MTKLHGAREPDLFPPVTRLVGRPVGWWRQWTDNPTATWRN